MADWNQFEEEAPVLANAIRERIEAHKHLVLGTLRANGTPRLSGIEAFLIGENLWIGSMPGTVKARDLIHDPRMSLHTAPLDITLSEGDAKITGTAIEASMETKEWFRDQVDVPPGPFHLFCIDIQEAAYVTLDGSQLVISSWKPGRPTRQVRRS